MSMIPKRILRLVVLIVCTVVLCGLPSPARAAPLVLLSGFPNLRQQHSLTCESSVASMATRGAISEEQLMRTMPRNRNPNLGFRGNPDGEQTGALNDYGVYAAPLHRALLHFGYQSDVLTYASDADVKASIRRGWPVVVWVTYTLLVEKPRLAEANGVHFILVPREHALLARGFDASTIIANDPWNGHVVRYRWRDFNRSWGYFGNMALSVEPCLMAQPVASIHASTITSSGLTWKWHAAANAERYAVTVTREGPHSTVVLQTVQAERQLTLSNAVAGGRYEIAVQSVDACGSSTVATRLQVQLPAAPTPTSTPPESAVTTTPTTTTSPTNTTTPAPTPTSVPMATAAPTPRK